MIKYTEHLWLKTLSSYTSDSEENFKVIWKNIAFSEELVQSTSRESKKKHGEQKTG